MNSSFGKNIHCQELLLIPSFPFFILTASAKTLSGLLEWECKTDAVEALTVLNHYQIRVPSKSLLLILLLFFFLVFFHVGAAFVKGEVSAAQSAAKNCIILICIYAVFYIYIHTYTLRFILQCINTICITVFNL